jgi:hypothetical protein
MQFETIIEARVPRMWDKESGTTHLEATPWAGEGPKWTIGVAEISRAYRLIQARIEKTSLRSVDCVKSLCSTLEFGLKAPPGAFVTQKTWHIAMLFHLGK